MCVRGPNNVARTVRTDTTLMSYTPVITEQKKGWELSAQTFDRFQTLAQQLPTKSNNMSQGLQTDTTFNIQQL